MIHLVTFASDDMSRSAELCLRSGTASGVDSVMLWDAHLLRHTKFYQDNQSLLDTERGFGLWAWKPFIISQWLARGSAFSLHDGDILIYSDAGAKFIEPVQTVIDRMDQDIWLFGNEHEHAHWCKRDIVEEVWPADITVASHDWDGATWGRFGKQAQASVIFFRVNDYTRKFVKEWLDWCLFEGGRLIDDSPSRTPNHPEFKENRHDQAILTTMAYREGIKLHHWYVRYETYTPGRSPYYPNDDYPPLYWHHRFRNSDWEARVA